TTVFSDSTAAVCLNTDYGYYECTYILDGEIITSTLYLLSEYGVTGVLIDPLILQVPADVTDVTATYDDGSGPQSLFTRNTGQFLAQPGITVTAEAGQTFIIAEFPSSMTTTLPAGDPRSGTPFDMALSYKRVQPLSAPIGPVRVKMMMTGKVVVREHTYYVPILPCVTSFSQIPAVEIPQSATPVNLQVAIGDLIRDGSNVVCDHRGYYFDTTPPPPKRVLLPLALR
ncbi:MAG: hypothetical protein IT330_02955, partial [Anaerolineae bacterium]|nr:hypothetical protein [Anaerolineae bacterium]